MTVWDDLVGQQPVSDACGANQERAPEARSGRRPARSGGKEVR